MKLRSFAGFVAPSVLLMLGLLALPLLMTVLLSVRNCALEMELATVQQTGPFGAHQVTTQRARVDASGAAVQACRWVGLDYYRKVLGLADNTPIVIVKRMRCMASFRSKVTAASASRASRPRS